MTQKRISNTFKVELHHQIIKLCHEMELNLHDNYFGPKIFTNYQRVALILLFRRSEKDLRRFTSELVESKWVGWLGLKQIPCYRSIHEWNNKFDLFFVRQANQVVLKREKPSVMAIDATGVDSWQRSRHYERRIKQCGVREEYMPYAKVDLFIDVNTQLIHDFVLRVKPRHDVLGATTFFKRCHYKNIFVPMDKGYDSEPLHKLAWKKGILSYAPVRDFRVRNPGGKHRRRCFLNKPPGASRRCLIESVNRSLKSRFRSLRSRIHFLKKRELGWHILLYNLERIQKQAKACFLLFYRTTILNRAFGGVKLTKQGSTKPAFFY